MDVAPLNVFRRALLSPIPLLSWIVIATSFALSGPFGTYERLSLGPRLAVGLLLVGLAIAVGIALRVAIQWYRPETGFLQASLSAALLNGALLAPVLPLAGKRALSLPEAAVPTMLESAAIVATIGIGMALLRCFIESDRSSDVATEEDAAVLPRLLHRLPEHLRDELMHLCAGDHYVEVVTAAGRHRLLMRFSDAISEVAPADGLRVHRSHWVALAAVRDMQRVGGRAILTLVNGTEVPVSRAYLAAVEELLRG